MRYKKIISLVLIFAIFIQSVPQTTEAGFTEWIEKLLKGIKLPQSIEVTKEGDLNIGKWNLIKCLDKKDLDGDGVKECINPFDGISIGKSQTDIYDENGRPMIVRPRVPDICALKIPDPENFYISEDEQFVLAHACAEFRRIQKSAANQVYAARKIFNNTDPLSECLFLKNCKTQCALTFGEMKYTISVLDVASLFLPVGWVNMIRKILNFAHQLNEIYNIYLALKDTINYGIKFLNDIFQQVTYLKTFYDSLSRIIDIFSDEGEKGFRELLVHYSDNLYKYSQAKSEAISIADDAKRESVALAISLANLDWARFLYQAQSPRREELQGYIDDFTEQFQSPVDISFYLSQNGKEPNEILENSRENGKQPVDLTCPEEADDACYIKGENIADECYTNETTENVSFGCRELDVEVSCKETDIVNVLGQLAGTKTTWQFTSNNTSEVCDFVAGDGNSTGSDIYTEPGCSMIPYNCRINDDSSCSSFICDSTPRSCVIVGDSSGAATNFICDAVECVFDWPTEFGTKQYSCSGVSPASRMDYAQNKSGSITVACPGNCTYACLDSLYNTWFHIFEDIIELSKELYEEINGDGTLNNKGLLSLCNNLYPPDIDACVAKFNGVTLESIKMYDVLNQLKEDKNNILRNVSTLPVITENDTINGENIVEYIKQYWFKIKRDVDAPNLTIAQMRAVTDCTKDDFTDGRLYYFDWDDKMNLIKKSDILGFIEGLGYLHEEVNNSIGTDKNTMIFEFLNSPLIQYKLDIAMKEDGVNPPDVVRLRDLIIEMSTVWDGFDADQLSAYNYVNKIIKTREIAQEMHDVIEMYLFNSVFTPNVEKLVSEIERYVGYSLCNSHDGILNQLKCFEEGLGRTFIELRTLVEGISNIEQSALLFDEIKSEVRLLNPSLEIPSVKINNLDNLLNNKGEAISFGGEDSSGFDAFASNILSNPLSHLEKNFKNIEDYFDQIRGNVEKGIEGYLQWFINDDKINQYDFFLAEEAEINKILKRKVVLLDKKIFGEEASTGGCNTLHYLLKKSPDEIENTCSANDYSYLEPEYEGMCNYWITVKEYLSDDNFKTLCNIENREDRANWWKNNICGEQPEEKWIKENGMAVSTTPEYARWVDCLSTYTSVINQEQNFKDVCEKDGLTVCPERENQKAAKNECDYYETLKKAINENCGSDTVCQKMSELIYKLVQYTPRSNLENMLTDESALKEVRNVCALRTADIKTPLSEVMGVYAVLLGIKSGTLLFKGFKTSAADARAAYQNAQKVIAMIKGLGEVLKQEAPETTKSGFSFEAIKCVAGPATGWKGYTNIEGGLVCPRIDSLFSTIEANFGNIRQGVTNIDMIRRNKEWYGLKIKQLGIDFHLFQTYPIKYHSVDQLMLQAKEIRERARNLWGIATAVNFANENCTCGMSYCKLPMCISGIPLTLEPLSQPYCYLVYILRYPMLQLSKKLENYLR